MFLLHRSNYESLLRLLSVGSSEARFPCSGLDNHAAFSSGHGVEFLEGSGWFGCKFEGGLSMLSLSSSFPPIVSWLGSVRLFHMLF